MDGRLDAPRHLRPPVQQRQGPFDLGRPDEADGAAWWVETLLRDELRQRARHLQDRGAAAGVVVRAGPRMIEMAAEDDLLVAQVRAGNGGRGDLVRAGLLARLDDRVQPDRLAGREPLLQRACGLERDHEAEGLERRECVEMAPADEVLVLAPPRRLLVLRVADDAC